MSRGNDGFPSEVKEEKTAPFMDEIIVSEQTFLFSFGKTQYHLAKQYLFACELSKKVKNYSEIARLIGQPNRTVFGWLSENKAPAAIKSLDYLKSIKLMPLKIHNTPEFTFFTDVVAFLFGDGHLMKDLHAFDLFGKNEDLNCVKINLEKYCGLVSRLEITATTSTITKLKDGKITKSMPHGSCWRLRIGNSALSRLLGLAGVPPGDKVSSPFVVPDWVVNGNNELKRRFLCVLFGNEFQCPRIRATNAFSSPQLAFHKVEDKEECLRFFLTQIKDMLNEFGITSSSIEEENCRTVRKDGTLSKKLYFTVDSHSPNILRLFKEIPFKYAEEKQERFAAAVRQFLKNSEHLKQDWQLYETVIRMHDSGLGRRTIFKQLQLPKKYFYKINGWIHYGNKPLYYDSKSLFG